MEALPPDLFGEVLLCLDLRDLARLSAVSLAVNTFIASILDASTSSGNAWWENKLQLDHPIKAKEVRPGLPANETYFLLSTPFVVSLRFALEHNKRQMRDWLAINAKAILYVAIICQCHQSVVTFSPYVPSKNAVHLTLDDFIYLLEMKQYDIIWNKSAQQTVWYSVRGVLTTRRDKLHHIEEMIDHASYGELMILLDVVTKTITRKDDTKLFRLVSSIVRRLADSHSSQLTSVLRLFPPKYDSVSKAVIRTMLDSFPIASNGRKLGIDDDLLSVVGTGMCKYSSMYTKLLLKCGATPNDDGVRRPLRKAIMKKDGPVIRLLTSSPLFKHACVEAQYVDRLLEPDKIHIVMLASEGKVNITKGKRKCPLEMKSKKII